MRLKVLLMMLAGPLVPSLNAQQSSVLPAYIGTTQIRTTATATRAIPPDLAIAQFEYSARDSTLKAAARAAFALGDSIRRAIKKAGVPDDSILGRGSVSYPWDQASQMEVKPNAELKRYDTTLCFQGF